MLRRLLLVLLILLWPAVVHARGITPQLVAEGPAPPGGEVELAIQMIPAPGWHGYWQNPGDAGLPMDVKWQLPKGFRVDELRYPVPTRLSVAGLMNFVYERDYAVLVRLKVPADAQGLIPIRAEAHWLACTDKICVPEQGELSLDLPVGTGTPQRAQFDKWRQAIPPVVISVADFEIRRDKLRVSIPLPASVELKDPYVFPLDDGVIDYDAEQVFHRSGDRLVTELERKGLPPHEQFAALLSFGDGRGIEFLAAPGQVPQGGTPIGQLGWQAVLWAVLGALVGGILLNLMPCVFPILGLKALHLARAGESAGEARHDALAYTAGAIVGTGALGVALLAIRAAGVEAGWAFQLQDPRTIMMLLLLAVAITANLLGVFELPTLGGSARPAGSFGTGALAAFVATPCAGPFLGVALGTALLLPLAGSILVFAALGLGLALPFLLIAFVPALRNKLPKPGPWMRRLQRFLAIPMAASALAALWLLYRQTGDRGLFIGTMFAIALASFLFVAGLLQRRGNAAAWLGLVAAIAVVPLGLATVPKHENRPAGVQGAERWSEARVASYVAQGHSVFVYFTADWCLTCKVNEAGAIDRDEVRAAFGKAGVKVLAGDWTNGDPAITRFLDSRGHAGVPFYLWYAPGKDPEQLPQVLTPGMLISRAQSAKP
ncbi:MAG TPA: protein-disulfide reductase DsbD domain-containing protein [Sphingomicrobium sp.]|nr:protein-disulfide reductase DsbD domain-containing protein [Sphingomicrobium sp.]